MPQVKTETSKSLAGSSRLGHGRADYTQDVVSNVNVSVQTERLAAVIKSSNVVPAAAGYDSDWLGTGDFNKLVGTMFADQNCTIYIEQSVDGETIHSQQTQAYTASSTTPAQSTWSYEITAPYVRLRVVPAATPTVFTVWTRLSNGA